MRRLFLVMPLTLVLGLAGCSADGPASGETEPMSSTANTGAATEEVEERKSPLDEYLGSLVTSEATDEERAAGEQEYRKVEELTAECMVEQGFE